MAQYLELMAEGSKEFLEEKKAIQDSFAHRLKIIENYRRSRREAILQEGLYLQQVEADRMGSKEMC
jgi:hypothetical protein